MEGDPRKEGGKEGKRIDMRRGERNRQSKEKRVDACSHRQLTCPSSESCHFT